MNERDQLRTADLSPDAPRATPPSEDEDPGREQDRLDPDAPRARTAPDEDVVTREEDVSSPAAVGPLLGADDAEAFRARWTDVQNGFVDAPRQAVEAADGLTAELMQHLAKTFADERSRLEQQWDRGDDVSTDSLRTAFQRYRSFFERLLVA
jgi:hypothetical protein